MIARITGRLEIVSDHAALVAVGGIAHEVLLPAYLAARLEAGAGSGGRGGGGGEEVTLHTLEYLESQNQGASFIPRLIGFASTMEREFFELLTSVKGLGNKRALRAMASEPGLIARAIHDRDTRALQRLPEIGPKLAELIVHELKGKVERFARMVAAGTAGGVAPGDGQAAPTPEVEPKAARKPRVRLGDGVVVAAAATVVAVNPPVRETVETLIALGEVPVEAERLVARAIDRARAAGVPPPIKTAELVAAAYASR